MLVGVYKHSVDSKNRIFVPAKFRSELRGDCMYSIDLVHKCLNIYSEARWNEVTAKIEAMPLIKTSLSGLRQTLYQNFEEIEPDTQGRIILNQRLCAEVGLAGAKEAVITGAGTHAQIWDADEWKRFSECISKQENKQAIIAQLLEMGF